MCRDVSCWLLVQICVKDMCCRQFLPRSSGRFQGKFSKVNKKDPKEMIFILIRNWRHFVKSFFSSSLPNFPWNLRGKNGKDMRQLFTDRSTRFAFLLWLKKLGNLIGDEAKEWVHISVLFFFFFFHRISKSVPQCLCQSSSSSQSPPCPSSVLCCRSSFWSAIEVVFWFFNTPKIRYFENKNISYRTEFYLWISSERQLLSVNFSSKNLDLSKFERMCRSSFLQATGHSSI